MLSDALKKALLRSVHNTELLKVMDYAVFPAGKLFRPRLIEALALDFQQKVSHDHLHLACAIELHHAYTLVHDDLPSMDNDLIRRGKASTHAKFGEWKAILTGDALLISSFEELSRIQNQNFRTINRLMTWTTGAKGLVEGQFLDLQVNDQIQFKDVVRIHELKTGRLIQLATLGTYLLSTNQNFRGKIELLRLGRDIGVSFQLLDDLSELTVPDISPHEMKINPFIRFRENALTELQLSHQRLSSTTQKYRLTKVEAMLNNYFKSNKENLVANLERLERNIGACPPDFKKWLTSFV